jgi:hypothetical protein
MIERGDLDRRVCRQIGERLHSLLSMPGSHDDSGFEQGHGRNYSPIGTLDRRLELLAICLIL